MIYLIDAMILQLNLSRLIVIEMFLEYLVRVQDTMVGMVIKVHLEIGAVMIINIRGLLVELVIVISHLAIIGMGKVNEPHLVTILIGIIVILLVINPPDLTVIGPIIRVMVRGRISLHAMVIIIIIIIISQVIIHLVVLVIQVIEHHPDKVIDLIVILLHLGILDHIVIVLIRALGLRIVCRLMAVIGLMLLLKSYLTLFVTNVLSQGTSIARVQIIVVSGAICLVTWAKTVTKVKVMVVMIGHGGIIGQLVLFKIIPGMINYVDIVDKGKAKLIRSSSEPDLIVPIAKHESLSDTVSVSSDISVTGQDDTPPKMNPIPPQGKRGAGCSRACKRSLLLWIS